MRKVLYILMLCLCPTLLGAQSYSISPSPSIIYSGHLGDSPTESYHIVNRSNKPLTLQLARCGKPLPESWNGHLEVNSLPIFLESDSLTIGPIEPRDSLHIQVSITSIAQLGAGCLEYCLWEVGGFSNPQALSLCAELSPAIALDAMGKAAVHYAADLKTLCFLGYDQYEAVVRRVDGKQLLKQVVYGSQYLLAIPDMGLKSVIVELRKGEEKIEEVVILR